MISKNPNDLIGLGGNFGGELGLYDGYGCNGSQIGVFNNKESNPSQLSSLIGLGV